VHAAPVGRPWCRARAAVWAPPQRLHLARQVTLRVKESNEGWSFEDLADGADVPEPLSIRGYSLVKKQQRELEFDQGTHLLEDP
jgi:hypothetical protein